MVRPFRFLWIALVLLGNPAAAAENWGQLKLGMTAEQTIAALGQPLLRTAGRGFETWTYDKGGDVMLYGTLISWTAPLSAGVAVRSKDIWQENRSTAYLTFMSVLPRRVHRPIPLRDATEDERPRFYYYRK